MLLTELAPASPGESWTTREPDVTLVALIAVWNGLLMLAARPCAGNLITKEVNRRAQIVTVTNSGIVVVLFLLGKLFLMGVLLQKHMLFFSYERFSRPTPTAQRVGCAGTVFRKIYRRRNSFNTKDASLWQEAN